MSVITGVVKILNEARNAEECNNYYEAVCLYNTALSHFTKAALSDELKFPPLKEEVEKLIEFCLLSTKRIVCQLQNEKHDNDEFEVSEDDRKIIKRIECSLLREKRVNFDNVCGMEDIKKHLRLAVVLPIKHPELYSRGRDPYSAFLFFGVRLTKI